MGSWASTASHSQHICCRHAALHTGQSTLVTPLMSRSESFMPPPLNRRRSVFDTDNIDIGPERRQYLDHALRWVGDGGSTCRCCVARAALAWAAGAPGHCAPCTLHITAHVPLRMAAPPSCQPLLPVSCACSRVWEFNDEGSIPYVPYLRAPYYVRHGWCSWRVWGPCTAGWRPPTPPLAAGTEGRHAFPVWGDGRQHTAFSHACSGTAPDPSHPVS